MLATLKIPLTTIAFESCRIPDSQSASGTFYWKDPEVEDNNVAELTLSVETTPNAFSLSSVLTKTSKSKPKFQEFITVLRNDKKIAVLQKRFEWFCDFYS